MSGAVADCEAAVRAVEARLEEARADLEVVRDEAGVVTLGMILNPAAKSDEGRELSALQDAHLRVAALQSARTAAEANLRRARTEKAEEERENFLRQVDADADRAEALAREIFEARLDIGDKLGELFILHSRSSDPRSAGHPSFMRLHAAHQVALRHLDSNDLRELGRARGLGRGIEVSPTVPSN